MMMKGVLFCAKSVIVGITIKSLVQTRILLKNSRKYKWIKNSNKR